MAILLSIIFGQFQDIFQASSHKMLTPANCATNFQFFCLSELFISISNSVQSVNSTVGAEQGKYKGGRVYLRGATKISKRPFE